jgi:alcohol dehydrogenase
MNNFEFYNPVHIVFGVGEIDRIGKEGAAIGKKALLVTYTEHDFFNELIEKIIQSLRKENVEVTPFFGVSANPKIGEVEKGVALAKKVGIDFVIGLGGGSAMDATKLIAAGVLYQGDLWDMVFSRHDNSKIAVPPTEALPILQIPTLPATGSEMNSTAVVTNEKLNEKSYTWSSCLFSRVSIIDPQLTTSLPAYQTACAGADTLSHVLEFYLFGYEDAFLNNRIQEGVMLTVLEYLPRVLKNPKDVNSRAHLQWASIVALNGWSQPGNGWTPMHQLGHVLSARTNCAHGASLSIVMPAWMKYYYKTNPEQFAQLATRVFGVDGTGKKAADAAPEGIERFESTLKGWGMPVRLSEIGASEKDIESYISDVVKVSFRSDGSMLSRPPATRMDIEKVFKLAFS